MPVAGKTIHVSFIVYKVSTVRLRSKPGQHSAEMLKKKLREVPVKAKLPDGECGDEDQVS